MMAMYLAIIPVAVLGFTAGRWRNFLFDQPNLHRHGGSIAKMRGGYLSLPDAIRCPHCDDRGMIPDEGGNGSWVCPDCNGRMIVSAACEECDEFGSSLELINGKWIRVDCRPCEGRGWIYSNQSKTEGAGGGG